MKTYELAKTLRQLAKILESGQNVDINNLVVDTECSKLNPKEVAVNLHTLLALSKIDKKQWIELISEFNFPINFEARDSARNILGKLMNYLEANPDAIDILKQKSKPSTSNKLSPLSQALDILLKGV